MNDKLRFSSEYLAGMRDGIKDYATVCARYGSCEDCPVSEQLGGMSCDEAMQTAPERVINAVRDVVGTPVTYAEVYYSRFPFCKVDLGDLSENMCRKYAFNGDTSCEGGDCRKCWLEKYVEGE